MRLTELESGLNDLRAHISQIPVKTPVAALRPGTAQPTRTASGSEESKKGNEEAKRGAEERKKEALAKKREEETRKKEEAANKKRAADEKRTADM
jgi:hypothetical protein